MKLSFTKLGMGAVAIVLAGGLVVGAGLTPRRAAHQAFMRNKLNYSQAILEGMTLEKYEVISKNAIRLREMTSSNLWYSARQPDYMLLTTNYQKNVAALYMAAVDKNLDRVTDAYTAMARSCVDCHRLVRSEQRKGSFKTPD